MHVEVGAGIAINAKIRVISSKTFFPVAIQMRNKHEGLGLFLVYRDAGYTRNVFKRNVQSHGINHLALNMDVERKRRGNKVCRGVSQFSSKHRKTPRDLDDNVLCAFC